MAMDAHLVSPASHIVLALVFAVIGGCAGYLHLMLLSLNIRALLGQTGGVLTIAASLGRGAVTIAAFSAAALLGALPLIAALVGFLIARAIIIRRPQTFAP
jgi:ABC-type maltose transport system permease subunit